MKLHRHYKNKDYKRLAIVKHSETLEELVLYETRYQNSEGHLWVRPKDLFFGSTQHDGKVVARFAEIPLAVTLQTQVTAEEIANIFPVIERVSPEASKESLFALVQSRTCLLVVGQIENKPVGLILGYAVDERTFCILIQAVVPEYQRLGIASDLMSAQEQWVVQRGYQTMQTKVPAQCRELLLFNLMAQFQICGMETRSTGQVDVLLEKTRT